MGHLPFPLVEGLLTPLDGGPLLKRKVDYPVDCVVGPFQDQEEAVLVPFQAVFAVRHPTENALEVVDVALVPEPEREEGEKGVGLVFGQGVELQTAAVVVYMVVVVEMDRREGGHAAETHYDQTADLGRGVVGAAEGQYCMVELHPLVVAAAGCNGVVDFADSAPVPPNSRGD